MNTILDPEINDTSVCLDILRYLAAQLVVIGHALSFFGVASTFRPPNFPYIQNVGTIVFFILSGFVIAHTLKRGLYESNFGLLGFLIDRIARIYSAYIPALLVIALIDSYLIYFERFEYESYLGWKNFIGNILMLQNYLGPFQGVPAYGSGGHLWSVAVEFHIYLFVGASTFFLVARNIYGSLLLAVIASPVPLAFFSEYSNGLPGKGLFILWILGFAIYFLCNFNVSRIIPRSLLILLSIVLSIIWFRLTVPGSEYHIKNYAFIAMAFLAFVMATQRSNLFSKSRYRTYIKFCANYSFSLYLLHYSILYCITRIFPFEDASLGALIGILVCNAFAVPFAYLTEFRHKALANFMKEKMIRLNISFNNMLKCILKHP